MSSTPDDTNRNQQEISNGEQDSVGESSSSESNKTWIHARWFRNLADGDSNSFGMAIEEEIPCLTELVCPDDESTALHVAARVGQRELINLILSQPVGTDLIQQQNSKGDLPFHAAAKVGQLYSLQSLVSWVEEREQNSSTSSSGSDNNTILNRSVMGRENKEKDTTLHIALENGLEEMARYLVEKWPQASYHINAQGVSPLYLAIKAKYWRLVDHMLDKHPISGDVADGLLTGKSVVHASIFAKKPDTLAKLLATALIDSYDEQGRTPLSYAAYTGFLDGVKRILDAYPNQAFKPDKVYCLPIHWAASGGHIQIIKEFFQRHPNAKVLPNNKGQNIIHMAASSGKVKMVEFLLDRPELKLLINLKDEDGNTPLHLATMHRHPRVVYLMTWDKRVRLESQNKCGLTALDVAEDFERHPSFEERLTLMALRYAGAPRAPCPWWFYNIAPSDEERMTKKAKVKHKFKERVNTLLLVATLVATVTFSAGFQNPGGYDNQGGASLAHRFTYQVFTISNTIAMYSSIIVAVTLIWAQLDDLKLVLVSLHFALPVLGVSLIMMSVAFMTGIYATLGDTHWLGNVVLVMGFIFIGALLVFFVPLYSPPSVKYKILRYIFHYPFCLLLLVSDRRIGGSTM